MKSMKYIAALVVAGGVAVSGALITSPALARDDKKHTTPAAPAMKDEKKTTDASASNGAQPGSVAPAFELKDTDGKTVKLADFKGKVVVLEWFNPECPFVVKHHKTFTTFKTLNEQYKSRDVIFLAINSSAKGKQGNGLELNKKMKSEYKIEYPVLIDESGVVGQSYGAKTTPHVFIIDTDGKVAYNGAIDNDKSQGKAGDKNYAKMALDEILAKKAVTTAKTEPYGCGVKYAN